MKITTPTPWRMLRDIASGSTFTAIAAGLLLFHTELGDGMPDWAKLGLPILSWLAGMGFFLAHLSPDKKSVDFRIW